MREKDDGIEMKDQGWPSPGQMIGLMDLLPGGWELNYVIGSYLDPLADKVLIACPCCISNGGNPVHHV